MAKPTPPKLDFKGAPRTVNAVYQKSFKVAISPQPEQSRGIFQVWKYGAEKSDAAAVEEAPTIIEAHPQSAEDPGMSAVEPPPNTPKLRSSMSSMCVCSFSVDEI